MMNTHINPISVDAFFPFPENFGVCPVWETLVEQANLNHSTLTHNIDEYPPDWQEDLLRMSDLILKLSNRFSDEVVFRIWNPFSPQGLLKCIRYRIHRFPSFLINQQSVMVGYDFTDLEQRIIKFLSKENLNPVNPNPKQQDGQHYWFPKLANDLKLRIKELYNALRDMLYGATIYEMVRDLEKERGNLERMFILVVFGDLLGIPIIPPYYTLRLIPFIVPKINGWQRSVLRERDFTDLCDQEIT